MNYFILVQEPRAEAFYESCKGVKGCLDYVDTERNVAAVGTRLTMVKEVPGQDYMEPLRTWRVQRGRKLTAYVMNPHRDDAQLELMRAARNAFFYTEGTKQEVVRYLIEERGANREDAFFAASAGLILARIEGYKKNPLSKFKTNEIIERMIEEDEEDS